MHILEVVLKDIEEGKQRVDVATDKYNVTAYQVGDNLIRIDLKRR